MLILLFNNFTKEDEVGDWPIVVSALGSRLFFFRIGLIAAVCMQWRKMPVWRKQFTIDKMSSVKKLVADLKKDARSGSRGLIKEFSQFCISENSGVNSGEMLETVNTQEWGYADISSGVGIWDVAPDVKLLKNYAHSLHLLVEKVSEETAGMG